MELPDRNKDKRYVVLHEISTVRSVRVMTERDEEAGGRGKQQGSGKPEGEVTGHGQADKARARVKTRAELLKISLTQQSLCCHEFQSCVSRESGARHGYVILHT